MSGPLEVRTVGTPLGPVGLGATARGLTHLRIGGGPLPPPGPEAAALGAVAAGVRRRASAAARRHLDAAEVSLGRFLAGDGAAFARLALDLGAATPFRRAVYEALRRVPPGETCTYGALAAAAGRPGAARAVGAAMAANPLPLAIPCHRVIGADGGLRGYSAGRAASPGGAREPSHDLELKRRLLRLEARGGPLGTA